MKALILKDIYTLAKQMRTFLLIIAVFTVMPNMSSTTFAIVYATLLPISTIAYDERSKWNTLAAMMPYTKTDIVLSKYLLGYGFMGGVMILSVIANPMMATILKRDIEEDFIFTTIIMGLFATLLLAATLPLMFKLGVEKGRIAFMIITAAVSMAAVFIAGGLEDPVSMGHIAPANLLIIVAVVMVVINVLSIMLSIRFFKTREV